jgi:hypothetical protein
MHDSDKPVLIAERRVAERYGVNWRCGAGMSGRSSDSRR